MGKNGENPSRAPLRNGWYIAAGVAGAALPIFGFLTAMTLPSLLTRITAPEELGETGAILVANSRWYAFLLIYCLVMLLFTMVFAVVWAWRGAKRYAADVLKRELILVGALLIVLVPNGLAYHIIASGGDTAYTAEACMADLGYLRNNTSEVYEGTVSIGGWERLPGHDFIGAFRKYRRLETLEGDSETLRCPPRLFEKAAFREGFVYRIDFLPNTGFITAAREIGPAGPAEVSDGARKE